MTYPHTPAIESSEPVQRPMLRFRLGEVYGNPPCPGGGIVLAHDGMTREEIETLVRSLYGGRLRGIEWIT